MDYRFWFWMGVAFLIGRMSKLNFYIGPDEDKYNKADFGMLIR